MSGRRTRTPPASAASRPGAGGGPVPAQRAAPPDAAPVRVTARCAGCGACLLTCPERAIRPHGGALYVRADLCTGCVECVDVCPVDAIEENVIQDGVIEKDVIEKVQQTVPGGAR